MSNARVMQFRIMLMILVVAGSTGCRTGATAISEEELQVLIPPGIDSRAALQLISGRGYQIEGPEIRNLVINDTDSGFEVRRREWIQKNIATCHIKVDSNPFDLVHFTNVIYVVIDANNRVEETISRTVGYGP